MSMFHFLCIRFKQKQIIRGFYSLGSPDMSTISEYCEFYKQNIFHMNLICKKCKSSRGRTTNPGHQCECGGILYITYAVMLS